MVAPSWDENPPINVDSTQAHLARIKFYRNTVFAHIRTTEVSDDDFAMYWDAISRSLEKLGGNVKEMNNLKTSHVDIAHYLNLIIKDMETIKVVGCLTLAIVLAFVITLLIAMTLFSRSYFDKEPDYSYHQSSSIPGFVRRE